MTTEECLLMAAVFTNSDTEHDRLCDLAARGERAILARAPMMITVDEYHLLRHTMPPVWDDVCLEMFGVNRGLGALDIIVMW